MRCVATYIVLLFVSQVVEASPTDTLVVMSYNVENLFDTLDNPHTLDDDFTPQGIMQWDSLRYNRKLHQLAKAISLAGEWLMPDIIVLPEVENDAVLTDLTHTSLLYTKGYKTLITSGADRRGINVGVLYDPYRLALQYSCEWPLEIRQDTTYTSRNILYIRGLLPNESILHLVACHLPSKRSGARKSKPYRRAALELIKQKTDSILAHDSQAQILVLGDFNATPTDKINRGWSMPFNSSRMQLQADSTRLYDLTTDVSSRSLLGSYYFRGVWQQIDRVVVSSSMIWGDAGVRYVPKSARTVQLIPYSKKLKNGQRVPLRTYGGEHYMGGLSDHFPVVAKFLLLPHS